MRRIPTKHLKVDSVIGTDVYDAKGNVLIKKNTKVNMRMIEGLKKYNIISVYVIDEYSPEMHDDVISAELRLKAVMELKGMCHEFTSIDIKKRQSIIKQDYLKNMTVIMGEIVDELLKKSSLIIEQIDIRSMENYNYSHSVNVAIISIIMGIELKYDRKRLMNIALAALLHDVGKALLPRELLYKQGERTPDEEELLRSHCELGYDYICKFDHLDTEVELAILQHHERVDGSGYPKRLKGDKINELAKIIAIANYYDNFMAKGYMLRENLPHNALEEIMAYVGSSFDYDIVKLFFRKVKPFLKGTMVRLNTGDIAIVKGTIEGAPLRPLVKIIKSDNEERINKVINLVDKLDMTIVELVYYIDN